ncbi:hypothetical protein VFPFJ_07026 [Purpureocillium lilacinum]|uniref:Uncharacterized protein n=1 Tax=Purpureocillium lilacinum TaxID=33203 RepID=A0A179GQ48_PURLI|nr:hypothetical protein VFPFJ_07026 [Purpureocillium lilacinum]OAQ80035.1 hypothetical protein VFPBJ_05620 [Purpureocillium lilacinum]OAQ88561.1 hypothetical protein VFPFJ_07026 [Purpureocillium lilacinum]
MHLGRAAPGRSQGIPRANRGRVHCRGCGPGHHCEGLGPWQGSGRQAGQYVHNVWRAGAQHSMRRRLWSHPGNGNGGYGREKAEGTRLARVRGRRWTLGNYVGAWFDEGGRATARARRRAGRRRAGSARTLGGVNRAARCSVGEVSSA